MSISWGCRLSVTEYAAYGRRAPAPRIDCPTCSAPLAFDGTYARLVREAGVVHRIFVRRGRCGRCGTSEALMPDFLLRRRRDTTTSVGAAILPGAGVELPACAAELYRCVPERTVRSWRQRFGERAGELRQRLEALCVEWRGDLPWPPPWSWAPAEGAVRAMGLVWRAARKRRSVDGPTAWPLANVIVGGGLLETRVDLPWPIVPTSIGRFRPP